MSLTSVVADLRHRYQLTNFAFLVVRGDDIEQDVEFESAGMSPAVTAWDAAALRAGQSPLPDDTSYEPIGPDTVFCLGSVTKTITALAVMQQVAKGAIDLDRPAGEYLHSVRLDVAAGARAVTVRDLLTHQSGLESTRHWAVGPTERRPSLAEYYATTLVSDFAPGSRWRYSNHGFAIAGQLVEDVDGRFYEHYVKEEIFDKLGMTSTDFVGHGRGRQVIVRPAGGMFTTANDIAQYLRWLIRPDKSALLPPGIFEEMVSPTSTAFGDHPDGSAIGLGFRLDQHDGHQVVFHNGSVAPFSAALHASPDRLLATLAWLPEVHPNRGAIGRDLLTSLW